MPAVAGKQPVGGLVRSPASRCAALPAAWAQHDVAVLAPLAAVDMNDHPLAVDVADLQGGHLGPAGAGGIERHEQDALKRASRPHRSDARLPPG